MKIKYNKHGFKWFLYGIISLVYSITQIKFMMYLMVILQFLLLVRKQNRNAFDKNVEINDLLLVSIVIPDNYIIIIVSIFIFLLNIKSKMISRKHWIIGGICSMYLILNIVAKDVQLGNVVMSIIYNIPFWLLFITMRKVMEQDGTISVFFNSIKYCIVIEALSTLIYGLTHLDVISVYRDMDWVTGTFGMYQCNVFMCWCSFVLIILWSNYERNKEKKDILFYMVITGIMIVSTGAVAYILIFFGTVILMMFMSIKVSFKKKIAVLIFAVLGTVFFINIVPTWMSREVVKLTDKDYIYARVTKIQYYNNTFYKLPKNEGVDKFVFGTGIGQYSSRAAETCGGGYVNFYDKYAKPYESIFRREYISKWNYGGEGLSGSSHASIISLQGELGFIGLCAMLYFFARKFVHAKGIFSKITIVYFVGLMFVDNSLEFAKYGAAFWMAYYSCSKIEEKHKGKSQIMDYYM